MPHIRRNGGERVSEPHVNKYKPHVFWDGVLYINFFI